MAEELQPTSDTRIIIILITVRMVGLKSSLSRVNEAKMQTDFYLEAKKRKAAKEVNNLKVKGNAPSNTLINNEILRTQVTLRTWLL